jgi:cysteinyl-tRNA synthetase
VDGLQAGARVDMAAKKNPTDFALWKFSPSDKKRLMEWDSPWGVGFPGWHIECSAMAIRYLGDRLDIHCGGVDHVNVHHTNEIAQAECALGHAWCNWWMHGEFLTLAKDDGGGKMSKSTGQFLTLQVLIDRGYDPIAYRFFLLGAHYRQQLAFSFEALDAAAGAMKNLKRRVLELRAAADDQDAAEPLPEPMDAFATAAADDLNMPRALAAMWSVARDAALPPGRALATLLAMDHVLGLGMADWHEDASHVDADTVEALLAERAAARKDKQFARADEIRDQLDAMGIELLDSAEGTTWRVK